MRNLVVLKGVVVDGEEFCEYTTIDIEVPGLDVESTVIKCVLTGELTMQARLGIQVDDVVEFKGILISEGDSEHIKMVVTEIDIIEHFE